MSVLRIKMGFENLSDKKLLILGREVKLGMTLRKLAYSILAEVDDDEEKLISTGYILTGNRTKRPAPNTPKELQTFLTAVPDELRISCNAVKNTDTYEVQISLDKINWIWQGANSSAFVIVNKLPLGEILYVQMRAKNPNGISPWSVVRKARLPLLNEPIMTY